MEGTDVLKFPYNYLWNMDDIPAENKKKMQLDVDESPPALS